MKGPESRVARRSAKKSAAPKKAAAAVAASASKKRVPPRPRVPGGKARARILLFEQQRADQIGETAKNVAVRSQSFSEKDLRPKKAAANQGRAARSPLVRAAATQAALAAAPAAAVAAVQQAWRPIGPSCIPHGQTYGEGPGSRPSVSGRISSVAVDPSNAQHILIGAGGGGVWESNDEGQTWTPRTDDQPSLAIGAVAFDPTNTSVVYAGTGEGDSVFSDGVHMLGAGLLRSNDGGRTWAVHAQSPFVRTGFYDIAVDPTNGNRIFAATSVGLFVSTNGGTNWTKRRSQRTWKLSIGTLIAANGTATQEILASCADGLFRSTNGGTSWSSVSLPSVAALERLEVVHAPSDANVAYAFAADANGGRLWRRSVFGGSFVSVGFPADLDVGQAWYDWFAAVAPNNPSVVYLGAIDVHKGVRSASGQWQWTNISGKLSGDSIHPDQHAIAFSPSDPNVVFVGNDGGLYRSPDGGIGWKSLNKGLALSEIEFLAQHPQFEAWLLAGTQDNGTLRYQGDSVWFHIGDGDGGDCGIDNNAPYTCYHTYYGMGVARSKEGGDWNSFTGPPEYIIGPPFTANDTYPKGSLFYPPMDVNGRVVAQGGNKVFISSDSGDSWARVRLPAVQGEFASALVVATTARVFAGTNAGNLFRIDFQNGQWRNPVPLGRPAAGFMSDLLIDPTNANRMFATFSSSTGGGRVFRSTNAGVSWTRVDTGLPAGLPVNAIEIDPANPDTLFVAADVGVYITNNGGTNWALFNNGLPNALVKDLMFHSEARVLRAGTQARGVWEIAIDAATIPAVEIYLRDSTVDTGRLSPSPSGVDDPFLFGSQTFWWQCRDIKVDGPTFHRPNIADVDFEVFSDDQSHLDNGIEFAAGLTNENPQRNNGVRVFVQLHNRGVLPATNVNVRVLYAAAGMTFPPLPNDFWTNPAVDASSPWQPISQHQVVAGVAPGGTHIAGFDWNVPADAPSQIALLAIISADNDPLNTTELDVMTLVKNEKKCGLRNVTVVNPPVHAGPPVMALALEVGGTQPASVELSRGAAGVLRGIVLSKELAKAARKAKWKQIPISAAEQTELARLMAEDPRLKKLLDRRAAFVAKQGVLVDAFSSQNGGEPFVLLLRSKPSAGHASVIQKNASGDIVGGITLQARKT